MAAWMHKHSTESDKSFLFHTFVWKFTFFSVPHTTTTQKQTKRMRNQRSKTNVRSRGEKTASTRTIDINFWKILRRETFHNNSSCCFFSHCLSSFDSARTDTFNYKHKLTRRKIIRLRLKKTTLIEFELNTHDFNGSRSDLINADSDQFEC